MKITTRQLMMLNCLIADGYMPDRNCNGSERRTLKALKKRGLVTYSDNMGWQATQDAKDSI